MLTTVDENKDLEAYIYIPTERSGDVHMGQSVNITDNDGKLLEKTRIDFISPQVDSALQGILVKAPVEPGPEMRNAEIVKADVIWSTKPMAVVPVLAVTRQGEAELCLRSPASAWDGNRASRVSDAGRHGG